MDRSLRYWNNAQIYRFARGAPLSLLIASAIVAIITIPKKKTSSPIVKEKRKAGTRAGLTKAAIVAAAAKLIESVGANGFRLRRLAKALGVGPTTVSFSLPMISRRLCKAASALPLLHRITRSSA